MSREEWTKLQVGMKEKWPQPAYMEGARGTTAFRNETFLLMTRMKADTKISYRPFAKAPGSKSHVRYIDYQYSKTAGASLSKGVFPADWCWDYERGFLRIDFATLRDEAIDCAGLPQNE